MGLIDSLVAPMLGQLAGVSDEGHEDLVREVGSLIEGVGGVAGLVGLFERHGMGELVASWVGNQSNLPVTPEQLESAFGSAEMDRIAQSHPYPREETVAHMAQLLPQVIDRLTPEGKVPEFGTLGGLLGTPE